MNPRRFYVYVLFRLDGTPFYVGKGQGSRMYIHARKGYNHRNSHKQRICAQILRERNDIPTVKVMCDLTEEESFAGEIVWIAALGRYPYGPLVNKTNGGDGISGCKFSEEMKAALRAARSADIRYVQRMVEMNKARTGLKRSVESVEKQRQKMLGRKHSEESVRKRSERLKGQKPSMQCMEAMRKANSRKQTPEEVEKRVAPLRGRRQSPEQVANAAAGRQKVFDRDGCKLRGRKQSPEHVANAKAGFNAAIARRKLERSNGTS